MVANKIFEEYYKENVILIPLPSGATINIHIEKVWENEFEETFIECFYHEEERPKYIPHFIVYFFTIKKLRHQVKLFSMDENVHLNLTKV